jgi:hypothetical protein
MTRQECITICDTRQRALARCHRDGSMARVWHGWLEEEEEARLASASLAAGDPTSWFDRLYAAGARGQVPVPWSRRQPHPLLVQWASARDLSGAGQRAVVVGCALGADAEYVAALGFDTTGFDISGTAIRLARQRFGGSAVGYVVADLLDYPQAWLRAYDLVIEISPSRLCPTRPAARPSPTSAAWLDPAERCLSSPRFTMTPRPPPHSRRGRCGASRSKRSPVTDSPGPDRDHGHSRAARPAPLARRVPPPLISAGGNQRPLPCQFCSGRRPVGSGSAILGVGAATVSRCVVALLSPLLSARRSVGMGEPSIIVLAWQSAGQIFRRCP